MSSIDRWKYDNQSSDIEEGEIIEENDKDLALYQFCVPTDDINSITTHNTNNKRSFNEIDSNASTDQLSFNEPLPKRQKVSSVITNSHHAQSLNDSLSIDFNSMEDINHHRQNSYKHQLSSC